MPSAPGPGRQRTGPARRIEPYAGLAPEYERQVGAALFPLIRAGFEHLVRTLGMRFRSAADVGCGTGRFLEYLLRRGIPLMGVDRAPEMLRLAARRLRHSSVRLGCQDLRRLKLPRPVDLITCNGDTLNYLLSEQDLLRAFRACHANLTPGGHLVADLLIGAPASAISGLPTHTWHGPGRVLQWRARVDPGASLTEVEIRLGRRDPQGWRWAQELHTQRWYPMSSLRRVLEQAGFQPLRLLWLQRSAPRNQQSGWLQIVANKE